MISEDRLVMELEHVGVSYPRGRSLLPSRRTPFWALKDISMRVFAGETVGIIGRNGAGKSTLLRLMAGIIKPDKGRFRNLARSSSLLSLQLGFSPHLTGRENIRLGGLLQGLSRDHIEQRIDAIIEFAELEEFIDEPIGSYSSGMRARLGFSTAIHIDPDVLLIDETLGVGDAAFQKKSKAAMKELIRSDKTVVLVTHSTGTIRALCDRAVWIVKGRVRRHGDVSEILDAYLENANAQKAHE
jgi:lipopolysaccharide transport system ATP-binding protein